MSKELEKVIIEEKKQKSVFDTLSAIDVSSITEKKSNLSYVSWAHAWAKVLSIYPDANYDIIRNEDNLPYFVDDSGAMCYTTVTIEEVTKMMWLPVMDSSNKSMKKEAYSYKTKYADKQVDAITMFDVNKTLMRCLVKNLAMFGFGLQVYAGEDLPLDLSDEAEVKPNTPEKAITPVVSSKVTATKKIAEPQRATSAQVAELKILAEKAGITKEQMEAKYNGFIYTTPFLSTFNTAMIAVRARLEKMGKK